MNDYMSKHHGIGAYKTQDFSHSLSLSFLRSIMGKQLHGARGLVGALMKM